MAAARASIARSARANSSRKVTHRGDPANSCWQKVTACLNCRSAINCSACANRPVFRSWVKVRLVSLSKLRAGRRAPGLRRASRGLT
jgi:hypothetical protein